MTESHQASAGGTNPIRTRGRTAPTLIAAPERVQGRNVLSTPTTTPLNCNNEVDAAELAVATVTHRIPKP